MDGGRERVGNGTGGAGVGLHRQALAGPVLKPADHFLAPGTFARRFAAATGTTPHRWLLDQRLHHAEYLLETTDLPIYEVARQCGLGSPDTLRHHFLRRRRTGPQNYRRTFQAAVSAPVSAPVSATAPRLGSWG